MSKVILTLGLVLASSAVAQVPAGWVHIVSQNSSKCLDMRGGPTATSPGVVAQQWSCVGTGQTNQIFQLIAVAGGYEIQVKNSGLAISPLNGATANATLIEQFPYTGVTYQTWVVKAAATSGYYTLQPAKATGSCLDVSNISTSDGALVQEWSCTGGKNQSWKLVPLNLVRTPTISSVSPSSGPTAGGTDVTITGTNFAAGATVSFGNSAAANVQVLSSTDMTAMTPAGNTGAVTVSVSVPGAQKGSLTNGFTYSAPAGPTITYVQGNYATPQAAQTSVTVPFPNAQAAGDLNVVVVGWNDGTAMVDSVTDSIGNTYELAVGPTVIGGTASQSIYFAKNIGAGANTITVAFSDAAAYPDIRILEYKGADQYSPVDAAAAGSGNSATGSSGSATTINATDLILGANLVLTATSGAGSGFAERLLTSPDGDITEDRMTLSAGTYSASAPLSSSGPWIMQMVAFRTSSGTTPTTHSVALTWNASASPNVMSYNLYRSTGSGTLAKIASGLSNTSYTDSAVIDGRSYTYAATAVDSSGNESAQSNTAMATVPNN